MHQLRNPREGSFWPLQFGIKVIKENNRIKHCIEHHYWEDRAESAPIAAVIIPRKLARGLSVANTGQLDYVQKTHITVRLTRCHKIDVLSAKTKVNSLSLKPGKTFPHKVKELCGLFISWPGNVPGPRPMFLWLSRDWKTVCKTMPPTLKKIVLI